MPRPRGREAGPSPYEFLAVAATGTLFTYAWLVIDPALLYHGAGTLPDFPSFATGLGPLLDSVVRPGGALEYTAALLAQLFVRSWSGAAVIVAVGLSLFAAADAALGRVDAPSLRFLRFVGPAALGLTFARYGFELQAYLAFVVAAGLATLVCRRPDRVATRWLVVGSLVSYHLVGGAHAIYALICALHEAHVRRRRRRALVALSTLVLTPFVVGVLLFGYAPWEAYALGLPFAPASLIHLMAPTSIARGAQLGSANTMVALLAAALFYVVFLSSLLVFGLVRFVRPGPGVAKPRRAARILALAAVVGLPALVHDRTLRDVIESDFLASREEWSLLLERAPRYSDDPLVLHSVNRALFHTGQLGNRMFEFPQTGADALLLGRPAAIPYDDEAGLKAPRRWRRAEVLGELGLARVATLEVMALLDWAGDRPILLRQLALLAVAIGDTGTARIALGELAKAPFDAGWANGMLDRLTGSGAFPEVAPLRRNLCQSDATSSNAATHAMSDTVIDDTDILERVVADCPGNRMAREYLLALHLLDRNLDAFVETLIAGRASPARPLPAHHQEAILLLADRDGAGAASDGLGIDPAVVERLAAYRAWRGQRTGVDEGSEGARAGFESTYWHYYDAREPTGSTE